VTSLCVIKPRSKPIQCPGPELKLTAQGLEDGFRLGKLSRLQLGINLFAIQADLKRASTPGNQLERANPIFQFQYFFRQTDGMRFVISSGAIFNRNFRTRCFSHVHRLGEGLRAVKEPHGATLRPTENVQTPDAACAAAASDQQRSGAKKPG
jgi:hypothetical protein